MNTILFETETAKLVRVKNPKGENREGWNTAENFILRYTDKQKGKQPQYNIVHGVNLKKVTIEVEQFDNQVYINYYDAKEQNLRDAKDFIGERLPADVEGFLKSYLFANRLNENYHVNI